MLYTVKFTKTVTGIVTKLHPEIKKLLKSTINKLSQEPYIGKELQEELAGFMSYRFKRYRIIYQLDEIDKTIIIVMFGHRRDVYELFEELIKDKRT